MFRKKHHARHFLSVLDLDPQEIKNILKLTANIKKHPKHYKSKLQSKTLLMIFQTPSLRTRISFEIAMNQMGGSALNYSIQNSPLAKGKETVEDMSRVISRYADLACLRIYDHKELEKFSHVSHIPIINAMTNLEHPCQILGDLFTIYEQHKKLEDLKLTFAGDCNNNITHSLLLGCTLTGMDISLACPKEEEFLPSQEILKKARNIGSKTGADVKVFQDPKKAIKGADIIYTDSWMSYRIDPKKHGARAKILKKYQVNQELLKKAEPHTLFMHNLPAQRGEEVTDDVLDGKRSMVLDQAENRLHVQKTIILGLLR